MDAEKESQICEIRESNELDCLEKLEEAKKVVESGVDKDALFLISALLEDCAEEAPGPALSLFDLTLSVTEPTAFPFDFKEDTLATLGSADASVTDRYIEKCLDQHDQRDLYYRSIYIPYLYQDVPEALTGNFEYWFDADRGFFEYTVKEILGVIYQFHDTGKNVALIDHLPEIQELLVELAESEGVAVDESLKAEKGKQDLVIRRLRQSRLVLEDLMVYPHHIDFTKVEENIEEFPNFEEFISSKESWLDQLEGMGDHPLSRMLTQCEDEYRSQSALEYIDHCCEVIEPDEQGTGTIRDNLLGRGDFANGVVELEVINALRREFGEYNVVLEEEVGEKEPDAKVSVDGSVVWVEATKPERSTSALLERLFGVSQGQDSDVRSTVTGKLRSQIQAVKQAEPDDLTALVVKNNFSKVDDELVHEYVQSKYFQQDQVGDHLDVLINFKHEGLGEEPYITGQIFDLGNVDKEILERLGEAFNADIYNYS